MYEPVCDIYFEISLIFVKNCPQLIYYTSHWRRASGAPRGRRLWHGTTIHNFAACFARCSLVAPAALPKIME